MSDVDLDLDSDNFFADCYNKWWIESDEKSDKNDDTELPIKVLGPQVARGQRDIDNGLRQDNVDRPAPDN